MCMYLFGSCSRNGNHDINRTVCVVSYHIEQIIISCHQRLCHCVPRNLVSKGNIGKFRLSHYINTINSNQLTFRTKITRLSTSALVTAGVFFFAACDFYEKASNGSDQLCFRGLIQTFTVSGVCVGKSKRSEKVRSITSCR